jgi:hypothetical protein
MGYLTCLFRCGAELRPGARAHIVHKTFRWREIIGEVYQNNPTPSCKRGQLIQLEKKSSYSLVKLDKKGDITCCSPVIKMVFN